jgi:phospholipid/cholesterol/gamma-HCH transport system permease protein
LPNFYQIGVLSLPVVALTGTFIGMVLAVQSYAQFREIGLETRMGAVINMSLVRELGPVLAATMLAGRVGSAMAAELGTMRVTEQIDALTSMGANPIHYLVVPRFLACLVLIPTLTIMADFMGVVGGFVYSVYLLEIDPHHYLENSRNFVGNFDLFIGVFKSLFFGAAIAMIACHRGFHCDPGAEGVGKAATKAFVTSFVVILMLDLMLGIILDGIYYTLWPETPSIL